MGLGNPLEVVVHHLLIRGMVGLGYRDGFPIVSALVCVGLHIGQDLQCVMTEVYQLVITSLSDFIVLSLNLEKTLSSC